MKRVFKQRFKIEYWLFPVVYFSFLRVINMNSLLIVLFCFGALTSCTKKQNAKEPQNLYIDISEIEDVYDISSDIVADVELVKLQTDSGCIIGRVEELIVEGRYYYVYDKTSNAIHKFSDMGKHISTLKKVGEGADEYVEISTLCVLNEDIWICDNMRKQILCYNKNLEMVKKICLKHHSFWAENMIVDANKIYLTNNWIGVDDPSYQLLIYDINNNTIKKQMPFAPLKNVVLRGIKNQMSLNNNQALVTFSYNDKIYQLDNDEFFPKYQFVFSERYSDAPLSMLENSTKSNVETIRGINNLYQTNNSIILHFSMHKRPVYAFFNKEDYSCRIFKDFKVSEMGNYYLVGLTFLPNGIISLFNDAGQFKNYFEENILKSNFKNKVLKDKLINDISSIKNDDNPVFLKFTFNENSNL